MAAAQSAQATAAAATFRENLPALLAGPDPWAALDENEIVGKDTPLEAGRTSKRIAAKRLLISGEGLAAPSRPLLEAAAASDTAAWGWRAAGEPFQETPMCTSALVADHPVEALFLAVAEQLKAGGMQSETRRAGFGAAWLEFEDLFAAAAAKRRSVKAQQRWQPNKLAVAAAALDVAGTGPLAAEAPEPEDASDGEDVVAFASPQRQRLLKSSLDRPLGADSPLPVAQMSASSALVGAPVEPTPEDEQRRHEVTELENLIQEAQVKYETTIRSHLQKLQQDESGRQQSFPQLFANVRRWQDQLEPVLKECASHPEFDIHRYSSKMLSKLTDIKKSMGSSSSESVEAISFEKLAKGQPRWEVCRRFLTCLLLTNAGNTDIVCSSEQDRINGFGVQLLKAEKVLLSYEDAEDALFGPGKRAVEIPPAPLLSAAEGEDEVEPPRKRHRLASAS